MNRKELLLIKSDVLEKYLKNKGWVKWGEKDKIYRQYISKDNKSSAIVPLSQEYDDYSLIMEQTLQDISHQDGITIPHLLTILTYPPSDIIRWRVDNPVTTDGMIPMSNFDDVLNGIRSLLAATAADELDPKVMHGKMSKRVKDLLESYSLGQTERGSYILNIICPLGEKQLEFFQDPLSRRVNERMLTNIQLVQSDIDSNNNSKIEDNVLSSKISVNFLDAIVGLNEASMNTDLAVSANWNLELPITKPIPSEIKISTKYIDSIAYIADKVRPKREDEEQTYFGKITSIKAKPELTDRETVSIVVSAIDDDRMISIAIDLKYSYIDDVNIAFNNALYVKVKGVLTYSYRKRSLDCSSFEVIYN